MSAQTEAKIRLAGVILLVIAAVAAAPVLDDVIGFLSDAPYVRYLPMVLERNGDGTAADVLTSAMDRLWDVCSAPLAALAAASWHITRND